MWGVGDGNWESLVEMGGEVVDGARMRRGCE